jgi:small-conductance mechanosensitive channel
MAGVEHLISLSPETQSNLLTTLIIILIFWVLRQIILAVAFRRIKDIKICYQWRKLSAYIAFTLITLLLGRIWIKGFQSVATFLGLLSAGLAIALKDLLGNLAGWAFILWRRPFEVGDRIQIAEKAGDVIDLSIFQFSLLEIGNWVEAEQTTGRIIHIPNGKVFTEPLANYHKGFQYIWNEIPVLITFESHWQKAKEILQQIVSQRAEHLSTSAEEQIKEASNKFMIFYSKLTPIVYTSVRDCGVQLTLRYICEPRRRRDSEQTIWEDILTAFSAASDIDLAYPTQRFYNNLLEGKKASVTPANGLPGI